ncbi:MAG: GNAT family N-acetyltransferase [Clostridiales bacterium]|nr:GNAT family N-acetyltransferase [Clostridiales bacterium]
MKYIIREMYSHEYPLLKEFLYEAIFQQDDNNLAPKSIIERPELQVYIQNFGSKQDDYCLCAEMDGKLIGAVWVRNIDGYGSIDDETPEFAISLLKEYRGKGIGTELMKKMIEHLKEAGYEKASLSVQKDNYAVKMYLKLGFQIETDNEEEYIMVLNL